MQQEPCRTGKAHQDIKDDDGDGPRQQAGIKRAIMELAAEQDRDHQAEREDGKTRGNQHREKRQGLRQQEIVDHQQKHRSAAHQEDEPRIPCGLGIAPFPVGLLGRRGREFRIPMHQHSVQDASLICAAWVVLNRILEKAGRSKQGAVALRRLCDV